MPTLLFADDGSLEADRAWLWILQHEWSHWSLDILTCQPPLLGQTVGRERGRPRPWTPTDQRAVPNALGCDSVRHVLVEEDPRIAVTNRADVALAVLGQRGAGALKSLHLGSTAEYVVQHLAAPAVIAKKPCGVRSVLVCADGSVHAIRAVDALLSVPWLGQIEETRVIGVTRGGTHDDDTAIAIGETVLRLGAAPALASEPRPVLRGADPAHAILAEAMAMSADLIVLGTRGLNVLRRGHWGSTARAVIESTESSVLVAHGAETGP